MATEHGVYREERTSATITSAAIAGVLAGVIFGLVLQFGSGRISVIGALYTLGAPSLSLGWVAHLIHSALFGTIFGLAMEREPLQRYADNVAAAVGIGLAYGIALWSVNVVFVWPLWLSGVGVAGAPSIPNLAAMPLGGHLVWGGLLGLGLWILVRVR